MGKILVLLLMEEILQPVDMEAVPIIYKVL